MPPNYLNAFELSFPNIASSVAKILAYLLKSSRLRESFKGVNNSKEISEIFDALKNVENIDSYLSENANILNDLLCGKM